MKNSYRILIAAAIAVFSLFALIFINYSNIKATPTGNFVSIFGSIGLIGGIVALIPLVYVFSREKGEGTRYQPSPIKEDTEASEDLYKIKGVLQRYGTKKKVDFDAIHAGVLEYARDLFYHHHPYLDERGSLGQYVKDIVVSSNPNAHGHFNERRGEGYIIGLFKELDLYGLIKYKI